MKTRNGFISNSSSSSFVVTLKDIPAQDRYLFERMVKRHNDNCCEGHLYIGKTYVHGQIDMHTGDEITDYLRTNNIPFEDDC